MRNKRSRIKVSQYFIVIFFFFFLFAIAKLLYVAASPTVDNKNLTEFAAKRDTVKKTLYASRGKIYDKNGNELAKNVNAYTLIAYLSESRTTNPANPQHVVDKEATAKALAEVLKDKGMTYEYALSRLNQPKAYQVEFGLSGKDLSENQKVDIEALGLPGISFITGTKRYYPSSKASYIIGYAKRNDNGEIVGEMGIEGYYNETLKGENGETAYQRDLLGYQIRDAFYTKEPVSGSDIYLTIDDGIQLILEDAISEMEKESKFSWFTISVMDAKTGAIVGSAASPSFNPNTLEGLTSYVNPLVGSTYEPGSTMKIYSFLAAMENGIYNGEDTFLSGSKQIKGATIYDFNNVGWGTITYDTGFKYSSNVGATNLALELGKDKLTEFYKSLGFGSKTGIELPGEEPGVVRMQYESDLASASFGQGGVVTTPIQNLQAMSILTNDGVMLKPYIVDKIVDEKGNITYQGERTELGQKVSSESVKKMQELMYGVVYDGIGTSWQTKNVKVAGKTGTAQIPNPNGGGYLRGDTNYIRSFAGFFPYEDPKYIVYASVKQINTGIPGISKIVRKVIENIANYSNVSEVSDKVENSKMISLNHYISQNVEQTVEDLEKLKLKVVTVGNGKIIINQYPLKNTTVIEGSKVFLLTNSTEFLMPDMHNWSSSEVITFCNMIGLKYEFLGYGVVKEQSIEPDILIDLSKTLQITLSTE